MSKQDLTLLATCDQMYLKHLGVMVCSARAHTNAFLNVVLRPTGVSPTDLSNFGSAMESLGRVKVFALDQLADVPAAGFGHVSTAAYGKFTLPNAIPFQTERALYLDADMVVRHDLAELISSDLDGCVLGAVENRHYERFDLTGISPVPGYFNSGLMLIDVPKWIAGDYPAICIESLKKLVNIRQTADQEALNLTFSGAWKKLDPAWNYQTHHASDSPISLDKARIIHFTGAAKPWHFFQRNVPGAGEYRQFAMNSPFRSKAVLGYPIEDNLLLLRRRMRRRTR